MRRRDSNSIASFPHSTEKKLSRRQQSAKRHCSPLCFVITKGYQIPSSSALPSDPEGFLLECIKHPCDSQYTSASFAIMRTAILLILYYYYSPVLFSGSKKRSILLVIFHSQFRALFPISVNRELAGKVAMQQHACTIANRPVIMKHVSTIPVDKSRKRIIGSLQGRCYSTRRVLRKF